MKLSKIVEALTPAQIKDIGSKEDEEEHYMAGAAKSRGRIVAGINKEDTTIPPQAELILTELVKAQLKFRDEAKHIGWHDIEYNNPRARKQGAMFPSWVSKRRYTETNITFSEPLDSLRYTIYQLSNKYFDEYYFDLDQKEVSKLLERLGFPKGMKLDSAYLWELNPIVATSDELGNRLIRTHSANGIPSILKSVGIGYNIYLSFIHHQGHACSDKDSSPDARAVWAKLLTSEQSVMALVSPEGDASMVISKTILADANGKEIIYKLADKFYRSTFNAGVSWILENRPEILDSELHKIIRSVVPMMKKKKKKYS